MGCYVAGGGVKCQKLIDEPLPVLHHFFDDNAGVIPTCNPFPGLKTDRVNPILWVRTQTARRAFNHLICRFFYYCRIKYFNDPLIFETVLIIFVTVSTRLM